MERRAFLELLAADAARLDAVPTPTTAGAARLPGRQRATLPPPCPACRAPSRAAWSRPVAALPRRGGPRSWTRASCAR